MTTQKEKQRVITKAHLDLTATGQLATPQTIRAYLSGAQMVQSMLDEWVEHETKTRTIPASVDGLIAEVMIEVGTLVQAVDDMQKEVELKAKESSGV